MGRFALSPRNRQLAKEAGRGDAMGRGRDTVAHVHGPQRVWLARAAGWMLADGLPKALVCFRSGKGRAATAAVPLALAHHEARLRSG